MIIFSLSLPPSLSLFLSHLWLLVSIIWESACINFSILSYCHALNHLFVCISAPVCVDTYLFICVKISFISFLCMVVSCLISLLFAHLLSVCLSVCLRLCFVFLVFFLPLLILLSHSFLSPFICVSAFQLVFSSFSHYFCSFTLLLFIVVSASTPSVCLSVILKLQLCFACERGNWVVETTFLSALCQKYNALKIKLEWDSLRLKNYLCFL